MFKRIWPVRLLIVTLVAAIGLMAGCGVFKKSDKGDEYKNVGIGEQLEIPPDLNRVPANTTTQIPSQGTGQVSAVEQQDFEQYEKFKQWEEFEKYLEWRNQEGAEGLDFESFKAARGGTLSSESSDVFLRTNEAGYRELFIRDDYDRAWQRLDQALSRANINVEERLEQENAYVVRQRRTDASAQKGFFSKLGAGFTVALPSYRLQVDPSSDGALVTVFDKQGQPTREASANQLLTNIYSQLQPAAKKPVTVAAAAPASDGERVKIEQDSEGRLALHIRDDFSQAWRRVGATLNQMDFTVEDVNRPDGTYVVRYIEQGAPKKRGFMSKLAFWRKNDANQDQPTQYNVKLDPDQDGTRVIVVDAGGARSQTGDRIISLLYDQMK